ncbi:MAG: protoporphyrinogen oxidase [Planctomycetota bacterium]|nr:protoporphyrinogen oxidase [Planctomycetota bacterium]MDW8372849.1 protoporphyrinogen oxidase [Planctomycetota bacterium]
MSDLIIVGGGIGGLASAWFARRRGWQVVLCEASPRLGGVVRSERAQGFLLEHGPDSLLAIKPEICALLHELGLESRLVSVPEAARRSLILHGERLLPVPEGLYLLAPGRLGPFLRSPLLSPLGKLRALAELVLPRRRPEAPEESLAAFVRRRLGREVLERLAQPLVAGIYGADPEQLSLAATFPQFLEMERRHGSLIRALWAQRAAPARGARYGLFVSLRDGLQELVEALRAALHGVEFRLACPVLAVQREGHRWLVDSAQGRLRGARLILALPAWAAAELVEDPLAAALRAIPYGAMTTINLGFGEPLPLPEAAGFVVPAGARRRLLACTFAHAKYPGRAPPGQALLRAFVAGPAALAADDEALLAAVLAELRAVLGPLPAPLVARVQRWPRSMAQYRVGHRQLVQRLRALCPPGLALVGNGYDGIGLPDIVAQAERAVASLA